MNNVLELRHRISVLIELKKTVDRTDLELKTALARVNEL